MLSVTLKEMIYRDKFMKFMNMEQGNNTKLIFGLSPKATIVNALVILAIAQVFWVLKFIQMLPDNIKYNLKSAQDLNINVPWYYDMPIVFLSMIMMLSWVEFRFNIKRGDWSWRAIKYKYVYMVGFILLFQMAVKLVLLLIFLPK